MQVPFGDLSRCYRRRKDEIDDAVGRVLAGGRFILGRELEALEEELARSFRIDHAVGVASGTDALALALRAVGVEPGDEVVTSPFSAAFTALAISQIGATPVFADIDPSRFTLDPARLDRCITPSTRAVVPVHLYGQPADLEAVLTVARHHGLKVVEDAAQAHGARLSGRLVGSWGDAAAFSCYPSKNLGAFGDAGVVTTGSDEVAAAVRRLRNGGQARREAFLQRGVNSRLDELQAAILRVRLRHLQEDNARRQAIAARYTAALAESAEVRTPWVAPEVEHVFHLYVVRSRRRQDLVRRLRESGIETAVHYPTPIHLQPAFSRTAVAGRFPEAERAATEVLSLPIFPELTEEEVEWVVGVLGEVDTPG